MKIHPICARCKFGCKKPYSDTNIDIPEKEFCKYFERIDEMDEYRAKRWKHFD